jgi:hypothetical protein
VGIRIWRSTAMHEEIPWRAFAKSPAPITMSDWLERETSRAAASVSVCRSLKRSSFIEPSHKLSRIQNSFRVHGVLNGTMQLAQFL